MSKKCYPPLFTPGFHDIDDNQLKKICVDSFPQSTRRSMLYCNFIQLIDNLRILNKQFNCFLEIWVDGSFTTEKQDPDDVDILVVMDFDAINAIPLMFVPQVENLLDRDFIKLNYHIDLLPLFKGDPKSDYTNDRMYWRGCFGYDREETPKGLARVVV